MQTFSSDFEKYFPVTIRNLK